MHVMEIQSQIYTIWPSSPICLGNLLPEDQNLPSANPNSSGICFRSFQDNGKPARIHGAYGRGARVTMTHPTIMEPNRDRPAAATLFPVLTSLPFVDPPTTMEKYAQAMPAERIVVIMIILSHLPNRFVSNPAKILISTSTAYKQIKTWTICIE